jgi:ligand-binding SRPBCC domain-containing protein
VRAPGVRHPDETLIPCVMRGFDFQAEQWLPPPVEAVFAFFSEARNLETLTLSWRRFEVLTPHSKVLFPGREHQSARGWISMFWHAYCANCAKLLP